ncbi:hypothetical protein FA13DRAFT_1707359 [Coprinellus micaceus]|uniref:Uncharacterized protein n=1 Tax=Coprinellus micaceus TaxID=71717 RepID=A0A4Y7TJS3_COPMI|nr:hypothetical protein FA13DRAFT_1707359 [Coprinellus micaceus]
MSGESVDHIPAKPLQWQWGGGLSSSAKSQFTIPTEQPQWSVEGQFMIPAPHCDPLANTPHISGAGVHRGWHGMVVMQSVKATEGVLPNTEGRFTVAMTGGWHGGAHKCGGSVHASRKAHAVRGSHQAWRVGSQQQNPEQMWICWVGGPAQ